MRQALFRFCLPFWGTLLVVTGCAPPAFGMKEASAESTALKTLSSRPQVAVTVSHDSLSVDAALDVHVRVTNLTDNTLNVTKIEVVMPGVVLSARGDDQATRQSFTKDEETQLDPGNEKLVTFAVPSHDVSVLSPLRNRALLTFMPKEYEIRVVVSYKILPGHKTAVEETVKIRFEPPLFSLIWGGIFGSMLLAAFLATYRALRGTEIRRAKQVYLELALLIIGGAVTAVIVMILLFRFKDVSLPLAVTVNDCFGGIVIGLFTYKLGDWLFQQISGPKKSD